MGDEGRRATREEGRRGKRGRLAIMQTQVRFKGVVQVRAGKRGIEKAGREKGKTLVHANASALQGGGAGEGARAGVRRGGGGKVGG